MLLLNCQNLTYSLSNRILLDNASLTIHSGERIGLLGRNGEGKSTLMRILSGELEYDSGNIARVPSLCVRGLPQTVPEGLSGSVYEIIEAGLPEHVSGGHRVERQCSKLGVDPDLEFEALSGGQKRRVLLGRALAAEPDVLLLDEPTNHLDLDGIVWLEQFLLRFTGCVIFVTHDRAFLQRLSTRIVELDRGKLTSWACDYPTFLVRKEEFLAAEEKQWAQFDKKLSLEEAWIRQGIKARRTRNEGRVRALEALRKVRSERRDRVGKARIDVQVAERSGQKVISTKDMTFAYPGAEGGPIVRGLTTSIMRGDRVGLIGPNGSGKTTLLNLLLGGLEPVEGQVQRGTSLEVAYFDQHRDTLDPERSCFDNIADGSDRVMINGVSKHVVGYLQDFLFSPDRVRSPVKQLSGGERARLLLARLFQKPSNVLVMDEPTNDLDAETLELLESRLLEYPGTLLLVSHDRQFLDNLCTSTLVFEGEGRVTEYVGGYSDWQRVVAQQPVQKAADSKAPAPMPEKAKSNKLTNKEREEWKRLPKLIEKLEQEQSELHTAMMDASFFQRSGAEVSRAVERSNALPEEIESAFVRWSELDARR